jgi:hypothetical protein
MTYRLIPILCLLAAPVAAQDVCPTGPGALTSGVRVLFDGMQVDFQRQADGRILETERHDGEAEIWFYVSDPSGLMFSSWMQGSKGNIDETTRETYSYDFGGTMPRAEPGSTWTGQETSLIDGVWDQQTVSWSYSKVTDYRIGACTYAAILITETRDPSESSTDEAPWINQYVHLIDLGLSIYLGGEELGTDPFLEVPLSISALTP